MLKGIVPPMLTPLLSNYDLDKKGVERLVNHMVSGGVHGLFILGTTGESASLSYDTRRALIEETAKHVNNRVPLLVGISDTSLTESLSLASLALDHGAAAVVATPPYYFPLGQEELVEYYSELADKSKLPIYLYNMPSMTKISMNVDSAAQLSLHPNIIGIKDSSANAVYVQALNHAISMEGFSMFVGPEEILAESVLMGCSGGVNGGANLFPKLYVKMYEAACERDHETIRILQKQIMEVASLLYTVGQHNSSYLKGLKGAASLLGVCNKYMAPPLKPFEAKEMSQIQTRLKHIQSQLKNMDLL